MVHSVIKSKIAFGEAFELTFICPQIHMGLSQVQSIIPGNSFYKNFCDRILYMVEKNL